MIYKGLCIAVTAAFLAGPTTAQVQQEEDGQTVDDDVERPQAAADDRPAASGQAGPLDQVPVAEEDAAADDAALEDQVGEEPVREPEVVSPAVELVEQFELYKQLMGEGIYDEADNVAKRVVTLAIEVTGARSDETAKALTNLGIVQHRNRQFDAAQQNFSAAIDIIEDLEDRLNGRLVNPLKGLGAAQLEGGRPDLAVRTFDRAVHITHVNEGPHNTEQIEILESLAETSLRLGSVEDARLYHDQIYALNQRRYESDQLALVPALMRRASWQHRAGYIVDEQATYRRAIRIIEDHASKTDLRLIEPLTKLGQSYFYTDMHEDMGLHHNPVTGEIYFKRALRIAEDNPRADWRTLADARLALGDYYMMQGMQTRSRKLYGETWEMLSGSDAKLAHRDELLGRPAPLNEEVLPQYVGDGQPNPLLVAEDAYLEGSVTATFEVNSRGRVVDLKIVEAIPPEFEDMQRDVQRELRGRLYRPRYQNAEPVDTLDEVFTHMFYYKQSDLRALQDGNDDGNEST